MCSISDDGTVINIGGVPINNSEFYGSNISLNKSTSVKGNLYVNNIFCTTTPTQTADNFLWFLNTKKSGLESVSWKIGNTTNSAGYNTKNGFSISEGFTPLTRFFIEDGSGKVGIGTDIIPSTAGTVNVANYKLFVTGGILTEEVRVNLRGVNGLWADYVFNKDYKLPTLSEVEKQIQEKGHLSKMPSAKEVKENGIELGEMAKMQQEKIEELTLYAIEQNKTNEKQSREIAELKDLVNKLINK